MSYVPSEETPNATHVVEDINGNMLALTCNWYQAHQLSRYQDGFLMNTCIVRLANEDDVAAFGRRLVDA